MRGYPSQRGLCDISADLEFDFRVSQCDQTSGIVFRSIMLLAVGVSFARTQSSYIGKGGRI
jgi:hypothetical protein